MVAENNGVVKPKYQQYTSLNKMWSNFSKVLMAHISFTAVIIYNGGIGKGIDGIRKGTTKNYIYVLWLAAWQKKETKTNEFSHLAQKIFKFSATSPVPIRRSGQTFMLIGPLIVTDYGF